MLSIKVRKPYFSVCSLDCCEVTVEGDNPADVVAAIKTINLELNKTEKEK